MGDRELPEGWEWKRLGDITKIQAGGTPRRGVREYWTNGTIPWVKISDLREKYIETTSECITDSGLQDSSAKIFPKGTILLSIFATLGDIGILKIDATCNQAIAGIIVEDKNVYPDYLYYVLKDLKSHFERIGRGVAQNNINQSILKDTIIPLPPLPVQSQIVAVLEQAEAVKRQRQEADALTGALLQSVFREMFGDPVENEKGWKIKKLRDLGDWTSGGTPSRLRPKYFEGDIPWYSTGELNDSYLVDSLEHITKEGLDSSAAKIFPIGTMLIGMYDSAAFKMGILRHPSATNQACAAFTPRNELINTLFALQLFKAMKPSFLSRRRGVRQKNLNQQIIKDFEVPLPPLSLQQQFARVVQDVERIHEQQVASGRQIEGLCEGLMQRAFVGELGGNS